MAPSRSTREVVVGDENIQVIIGGPEKAITQHRGFDSIIEGLKKNS